MKPLSHKCSTLNIIWLLNIESFSTDAFEIDIRFDSWFVYIMTCHTSDIISNRCGLSINTWRQTIAFSAGFVFITMPAGWLEKEPLIYFHSFFVPDPFSRCIRRSYYYYFQVKYTRTCTCVYTRTVYWRTAVDKEKKSTYDLFFSGPPNNSIVILRPNDFFISANLKTTIILLKLTDQWFLSIGGLPQICYCIFFICLCHWFVH